MENQQTDQKKIFKSKPKKLTKHCRKKKILRGEYHYMFRVKDDDSDTTTRTNVI